MERSDFLMGTVVEQRVDGRGPIRSRRIAAKVAREIDRLAKLWSVIAAGATDADAFATAVFVMGLKTGLTFLEQLLQVEGLVFDRSGAIHLTKGLQGRFFAWETNGKDRMWGFLQSQGSMQLIDQNSE